MTEATQLRNGTAEAKGIVDATMLSLRMLIVHNPVAFSELVEVCRDPAHELFGDAGEILSGLCLLQSDLRPHESIRNIVCSAAEGEGIDLRLVESREEADRADLTKEKGAWER